MWSRQTLFDRLSFPLWMRSFGPTLLLAILCATGVGAAEPRPSTRYDGLTLDEWDARIKAFPFSSPEATRSVPGLIKIAKDAAAPWESRRQAALTLGRMGTPARSAVPLLTRLAVSTNETEETRLWALTAIARFGPVAAEFAPDAAKILATPAEPHLLRMSATEVLGRIATAHAATLPSLLDQLSRGGEHGTEVSREADLRVACTDALALFGGSARGAVPVLLRQMRRPGDRIRQSTLTTLASIGPAAESASVPIAEVLVSDPVPLTRDRAAEALVQIGVTPLLVRLLEIPRPETRERIAVALIRTRRPVNPALATAIRKCAESDTDQGVQAAALKTDWAWTKDADSLAPVAVTLLGSDDRRARKSGYEVLTLMGEQARRVVPALERLAEGAEPQSVAAARSLLRRLRIGTNDPVGTNGSGTGA